MSDKPKCLGRLDNGITECGRIVMSRWDRPEESKNGQDRKCFIKDIRRSGYIHVTLDRHEGDPMSDWVGQSYCEDLNCRCQIF